jgi:hypothetical protein
MSKPIYEYVPKKNVVWKHPKKKDQFLVLLGGIAQSFNGQRTFEVVSMRINCGGKIQFRRDSLFDNKNLDYIRAYNDAVKDYKEKSEQYLNYSLEDLENMAKSESVIKKFNL